MTYTPRTWAGNDDITAARLQNIEQGIVDAHNGTFIPRARIGKSANSAAIVSATWTKMDFDTVVWDQGLVLNDQFDNANDRLYPVVAGLYVVTGKIEWAANTTGDRALAFYKNGAQGAIASAVKSATAGIATIQQATETMYLNPANPGGDYIELWGWHNIGVNTTVASRTYLEWHRISP